MMFTSSGFQRSPGNATRRGNWGHSRIIVAGSPTGNQVLPLAKTPHEHTLSASARAEIAMPSYEAGVSRRLRGGGDSRYQDGKLPVVDSVIICET